MDNPSTSEELPVFHGGMRIVPPVTDCLFYGLAAHQPDGPMSFGPATGLAVCPIAKLPEMAAQYVSVGAFIREKLRRVFLT